MRRSVRSYRRQDGQPSNILSTLHRKLELNNARLTMPVSGSTTLDNVSTATTWVDLSFHGQYLRQLAVETSFQE